MKIKHGISFVISFMMILSMLSICPVKAETLASEGLSNNAPSEKDIVDYLKSHDISKDYEDTFATPFTTRESKSSYDVSDAGALSDASQQKALEYLNAMRYIAGVDPVKLSSDLESKAQCSAYVNYLNDESEHKPKKTDAMSDALYNLAKTGSRPGNLAWASANNEEEAKAMNMENAVDMWLSDTDKTDESADNEKVVGHRRWSLDPLLSTVGFGKAYGVATETVGPLTWHATMSYAYDKTLNKSQKGLSWPAAHMPINFFDNDVWSYLSVDGLKDDNLTVTLTRKKSSTGAGPKTWTMTKTANDDGVVYTDYALREGKYTFNIVGHTDAVIFKPNNMDIHAGDVYNVKITGVGKTVDYDVSFFDPDHVSSESNPVTKINLDQSILNSDNQLALTKGESYDLTKYISIEPSDADDQDLSYSSSDENVATCTDGTIEALTAGETTITVKSTNDVTLTIPVKVTDQEATQNVSVPKGKTYTYDGEEHEVSLPDHVVYADDRYSDKTATNVGDYTYYVKPEDGYTWEDGTTDEEKIKWSITKADNSAETFEADDVTYPEKPSVKAQLKYLDDDKEIMYKEENASDDEYSTEVPTTPGTYIVKVSSEGNHNVNAFENERKFIIHKGTIDTSDIVMEDQHATYDGQDHSKDMQLSGTDINDSVTLTITNQDDEQVEEAIEPGSYKVTATIHRDYYKDATKTATLTITEKEKNENAWTTPLTISSDDITYGDDYDVKAVSQYGDVTYTYQDEYGYTSSEKPTQAGTYTVIASVEGTDQYTSLKAEKRFTIKRKKVSIPDVTTRFVYDGNMHQICEYGAYYYISHASECDAGSYSSKLILYDNYEWEDGTTSDKEYSWTIEKADNEAESFDVYDVTYPEKPDVTVQLKYLDDDKNVEYKKVDASDDAYTTTVPSSPGDYNVRVTCKGSDNVRPFEEVKSFTIYNATLDASGFEMSDQTVTYDGADHSQDVQVTGTDSNDEVSYEITDENGDKVASAIEPGVYNIRATIHRDNYDDAYKYATLTITEKEKNENTWTTPLTISYDDITYGDDYKVNAESKYGDVTYTYKDEDGNVLSGKPTDAGTYTVIAQVEETNQYTSLKDEKTFTIKRKKITIPEVTNLFTYDGEEHRVCEDGEGFHVTDPTASNVGIYHSKLVLNSDNYEWTDKTTGTRDIEWSISKADNSIEIFDVDDVTYPDKPHVNVKLKYPDGDKVVKYKKDGSSDYTKEVPSTPGTYTVRVTSDGSKNVNAFEQEKTFTIDKGKIDDSYIVMNDETVTYDGQDHSKDIQLSGTNINDSTTMTITNEQGEEVQEAIQPGTYKVKATIHRDYYEDLTKTAMLTIKEKDTAENEWTTPLTVSDDITYGDDYDVKAKSKYGDVTYTYKDEDGNVLSGKPTNAGTYTVIAQVEGTKDYTSLKDEKTFTIFSGTMDISDFNFEDMNVLYDGNEHIHDLKVTGVPAEDQVTYEITDENGDVVSSAKDPGQYYFEARIHRKNYDDEYLYATLTISQQTNKWLTPIYVSSASDDIRYGDHYDFYAVSQQGNVEYRYEDEDGDELYDQPTEAGSYKVIATVEATAQYMGLQAEKTFTIKPKKVAVPKPQTFTYDGQEHTIDASEGIYVDGFAVNVGTYSAEVSLENDNYIWNDDTNETKEISYTIKPKEVAIPNSQTFTYDGQEHTISASDEVNVENSSANIGTHYAKVSLKNDNYIWSDGTSDPKEIAYTIVKKETPEQTADQGKNEQSGENQSHSSGDQGKTEQPQQPNINEGTTQPQTQKTNNSSMLTPSPAPNPAPQPAPKDTVKQNKQKIIDQVTSLTVPELPQSAYQKMMVKQGKTSSTSVKVQWKKVKNAMEYLVFGTTPRKKYKKLGTVKKTSYINKKLKKNSYHQYMVVAVDSHGQKLASSKAIYVKTGKSVTKIKTMKTLKVKKGKSVKVKASLKGKIKVYRKIKLESSNSKIAKVKGMKVKGIKKGKCIIYAYAQNGTCVKIKVTVK